MTSSDLPLCDMYIYTLVLGEAPKERNVCSKKIGKVRAP